MPWASIGPIMVHAEVVRDEDKVFHPVDPTPDGRQVTRGAAGNAVTLTA
jgi:hypothetical protein